MKADISFESKCIAYLVACSEPGKFERRSQATGFFWRFSGKEFLITNRHVVTGRDSNNCPIKDGFDPLFLQATFYRKKGPSANGYTPVELKSIKINLWKDGRPDWIEHSDSRNFDLVAMDLGNELDIFSVNDVDRYDDIWMEAGADCFIVGFPEKLAGPGLTPIWKRASIATEPEIPIDSLPIFLCDTSTRPGMSGSPVFVKAHGNFGKEGSPMGNSRFFGFWTQLIGIYSGRNGNETDGFQLARVWNAGLVDEMLNDPRKPELPFKQK